MTDAFSHYPHRRDRRQPPKYRSTMSSPINFPDSDVDMEEHELAEQSMPNAPPLFDPATPSTTRGTPRKSMVPSTPGITARRALGMSTPKSAPRTPLFEGTAVENSRSVQKLIVMLVGSSSPMNLPSSSPKKTPRATRRPYDADFSSDPIDFPSYDPSSTFYALVLTFSAGVLRRPQRTDEGTFTQLSV